jgi:hypothetical protein
MASCKRKPAYTLENVLTLRVEEWAREQQGSADQTASPAAGRPPKPLYYDVDKIITWLRSKRSWDYARKPEAALRAGVKRSVEHIETRLRSAREASGGPSDGKRPRLDGADDADGGADGDGDSSDADEPPAGVRLMEAPTHNLLNMGLAARYKKAPPATPTVQPVAAPAAAESVPDAAPAAPTARERKGGGGGGGGGGGARRGRSKRAPSTSLVNYSDLGGMESTLQVRAAASLRCTLCVCALQSFVNRFEFGGAVARGVRGAHQFEFGGAVARGVRGAHQFEFGCAVARGVRGAHQFEFGALARGRFRMLLAAVAAAARLSSSLARSLAHTRPCPHLRPLVS